MTTIFTSTEGASLNVDAWSNEILDAYSRKLVMAKCCTDVSSWAKSSGGFVTLEIPAPTLLNSGAARSRALTVGNDTAITFDKQTTAKVTITISSAYYLATGVTEGEQAVSGYDIIQMYTPNIAESLSRTIDGLLTTLVTSLTTNDVGALIEDPTFDDILLSVQKLDDGDVPHDNRNFVGSNAFGTALMKMGQLTSIDYTDSKPLTRGDRQAGGHPLPDLQQHGGVECRWTRQLPGPDGLYRLHDAPWPAHAEVRRHQVPRQRGRGIRCHRRRHHAAGSRSEAAGAVITKEDTRDESSLPLLSKEGSQEPQDAPALLRGQAP